MNSSFLPSVNLEVTPYLINRTAIARIIRDTKEYFRENAPKMELCCLGTTLPRGNLPSWLRKSLIARFKLALKFPFLHRLLTAAFEWPLYPLRGKRRRLFFDPLYVEFYGKIDESTVFVLDLTPITMEQWHDPAVVRLYRLAFRKISASRCKILSISESTTLDLRTNLGIDPDRIVTVPLYLPDFGTENGRSTEVSESIQKCVREKFFLFVGSLEMRKNLLGLIQGFMLSGLVREGYKLLIAGGDGRGANEIRESANVTEGVQLLGYVSDDELDVLYRNAAAFVYPSYWEGFGVPLLEAMSRRTLTVSTMTGASPEVSGGHSLFVDPCDTKSIASGFVRVARLSADERMRLIEGAFAHSKKYNFESYADTLIRALDR